MYIFSCFLVVHLISAKEAMKILGDSVIEDYREQMKTHRKEIDERRKQEKFLPSDWGWRALGKYVSLPLLWKELGVGKDSPVFWRLTRSKRALILVHPGYAEYNEDSHYLLFNPEAYGDYKADYVAPLIERVGAAMDSGEPILVYAPQNRLEATLFFVRRLSAAGEGVQEETTLEEETLLVPTGAGNSDINSYIFGVPGDYFQIFLSEMGIEEVEVCCELYGRCYNNIINKFTGEFWPFDLGVDFKVKRGVKFPVEKPIGPVYVLE